MNKHSLTTWMQLEPRTRDADLIDGLQAAVYDPLWLLGRQWQVGEFHGTDGGSPVEASIDAAFDPITHYQLGDPTSGDEATSRSVTREDGVPRPLEMLVEREPVRPSEDEPPNYKLAAEAGQQFLRLLTAAGFAPGEAFDDFRLSDTEDDPLDPQTRRFLLVVGGRALDGRAIFDALEDAVGGADSLPRPPGVEPETAADQRYQTEVVDAFRSWYRELYDEPEDDTSAWDPTRLEYRFAVSTGSSSNETVHEAREYTSGRLDWYSFDVLDEASLMPSTEDAPDAEPSPRQTRTYRTLPTAIEFPGMPRDRWWEFEDDELSLPNIEVAQEDLSRLLLLEFGLVYGNDWFGLPIEIPVGSLVQLTDFTVTDTFGAQIRSSGPIPKPNDPTEWNLYSVPLRATDGGPTRGLFFAPGMHTALESGAVEVVEFARDEMANLAWAIERQVESSTGHSLDRTEESQQGEMNMERRDVQSGEPVPYRLMTEVPDYWYPLLPERADSPLEIERTEINFVRGRFVHTDPEGSLGPRGRILAEINEPIPEEEIPRVGVSVSRTYQLTRWLDGSTYLWSGRKAITGTGARSSGLAFDVLDDGRSSSTALSTEDST